MNTRGRKLTVAAMVAAAALVGCAGDEETTGQHQIWFMGSVFDGASGAVLTAYDITLVYGQHRVKGTVDAAGRYVVGPLPAWNDYGIEIGAGLGVFKGKVWRIGLMGHSSSKRNVMLLTSALAEILKR